MDEPFDELFEEVSRLTPEERVANRERNERKIMERWAEHEALRLELKQLRQIASPSPEQLRRIAELVDELHGGARARKHWEKAAEAGDPVAMAQLVTANTDISDIDPIGALLRQALQVRSEVEEISDHDLEETRERILGELRQYHRDTQIIRSMEQDFE